MESNWSLFATNSANWSLFATNSAGSNGFDGLDWVIQENHTENRLFWSFLVFHKS